MFEHMTQLRLIRLSEDCQEDHCFRSAVVRERTGLHETVGPTDTTELFYKTALFYTPELLYSHSR